MNAPADGAFAYLCDPIKLGRWSLGCFDTSLDEAAKLHTGLSLFDGGRGWFRIEPDPAHRLIDYRVGTPSFLSHRISARVIEGGTVG
ncbi:SRPBCC family protein, partial [Corallococcus exiguus]|uniref:SRPBCC family protein n=1 Tax=Corallococcus exiguus TaxID=83462 RepID=UPI001B8D2DF7